MDLKKFSPKDAAVIRRNPGKSPKALLEMGLSRKAYERLQEEAVNVSAAILEPVRIEKKASTTTGMVNQLLTRRIQNLRTGNILNLRSKTVELLLSVYPNEYKLV
jgi:hypothetical protein